MVRPSLAIFICGTYADLVEERAAVINAVNRLHFQHGSMEFFGARPEAPIEVCLEEVRQSDVLVVILGHRYGTLVPGRGVSFTEAEYNEGFRAGKSCFVYVRDDRVPILPGHVEQDPQKIERLRLFRQLVEDRHTVFRFHDSAELALQVTVDLNRSMARADSLDSAAGIIRRGADAWNAWRTANRGAEPRMHDVDLSDIQLEGTDFSNMEFRGARFVGATLSGANLQKTDMEGANFCNADLKFAQLEGANLSQANLMGTDLSGANLTGTNLHKTLIIGTVFRKADLSGASFNNTVIANSDFSDASGLVNCVHNGPSSIDLQTVIAPDGLPAAFLRGVGLPEDLISILPSLWMPKIEFYSCFISYSTRDQDFAARLSADLQNKGVRCWFAPNDLRAGQRIHEQIDEAIRLYDRLLVILSEHSIRSEWVLTEVAKARRREAREGRRMLFPVSLIPLSAIRDWSLFDTDTGKDLAREVREYFIPDFSNWKDHDSYQRAFEPLLRDLRSENFPTPMS
jgi:uncharacterized protein YjbI with pentapeptide repeats